MVCMIPKFKSSKILCLKTTTMFETWNEESAHTK